MGKLLSKRKIIALLIILFGLTSSIIILNYDQDKKETKQASNESENSNSELLNFESVVSDIQADGTEQEIRDNESNRNVTDTLINSFASDLAGGEELNITEEELNENLNNSMSFSFSDNLFSLKDIQVSENNSTKEQIEYIERVEGLVYENFKDFEGETSLTALKLLLEDNDPKLVNYLVRRAPHFINDMLSLEAPPSLTKAHIEIINIWQKKLEIYKAIENYEEDPLKAYAAIQELSNVIQEDIDFQTKLIETYQNLNS